MSAATSAGVPHTSRSWKPSVQWVSTPTRVPPSSISTSARVDTPTSPRVGAHESAHRRSTRPGARTSRPRVVPRPARSTRGGSLRAGSSGAPTRGGSPRRRRAGMATRRPPPRGRRRRGRTGRRPAARGQRGGMRRRGDPGRAARAGRRARPASATSPTSDEQRLGGEDGAESARGGGVPRASDGALRLGDGGGIAETRRQPGREAVGEPAGGQLPADGVERRPELLRTAAASVS